MTFKILSEEQLNKIHCSAMHVLEKVGIEVPHEEILSRFSDFGASVDMKKQTVKIPPDLVTKLVKRAGKQFTLYGTDLNKTAEFGRGKRNYNSTAGQALWLDDLGQMRRYGNLDDLGRAVRFADALEFINIPGAMVDPHEFPIGWRCVAVLIEMLKNTAKPVTFWFNDRRSAKYIVEILIALRGDEKRASQYPLCYPFLEPISPLRFPYNGIDLLFETSRLNMPVPIGPMVQMGLSSPVTISSTLTMENAEILAGICITQLVKPGVPVCYGGICHAFDMATTQIIFGGPEQAIFSAAMAQMGKYYGLPVYINAGLFDSKTVDAQAGIEASISLTYGAVSGADIFGHMGICGADQAASLDVLVMQHELIRFIESTMRDIDCSNDALALQEIEEVGPGGIFLDRMHTAENFRKALWFPRLMDREYYQSWYDGRAEDMAQRCKRFKNELLSISPKKILPNELEKTFSRILSAAKRELEN